MKSKQSFEPVFDAELELSIDTSSVSCFSRLEILWHANGSVVVGKAYETIELKNGMH